MCIRDSLVGRVNIAESLRTGSLSQFLAAIDVDEGSLLFALVLIEYAHRNLHAEAEGVVVVGICLLYTS